MMGRLTMSQSEVSPEYDMQFVVEKGESKCKLALSLQPDGSRAI